MPSNTILGRAVAVALLAGTTAVFAQSALAQTTGQSANGERPPELAAVPEPPDIPKRVKSGEPLDLPPPASRGEAIEPEITIRRTATETITEYRVNGVLRAVKVENGDLPPYYIVDTDGDGVVDTRHQRWSERMLIPQWVLFRW